MQRTSPSLPSPDRSHPGASADLEIAFDAATDTGDLTAVLTITSNDPDDSPITIDLAAFVDPDGDSDDDGRSDAEEQTAGTNPLNPDTDDDSLNDLQEFIFGTNPLLPDSDGDGFTDPQELFEFDSDPNSAEADGDGDELTDAREFIEGTNPGNPDTDGDTLSDGAELTSVPPTNPLSADTDNDGINDGDEENFGTNPTLADSDNDGFFDGEEANLSTNPNDGNDPVAGGLTAVFSTGFEYAAGAPVVGTDAANLDGADGQIGNWSGTVPESINGTGGTELFTFQDVFGDQYLLADIPGDIANFSAVFASPVSLDSARVRFDLAVRRTTGNFQRNLVIVGLDSQGNEAFHLVVSAISGGPNAGRIGIRTLNDDGTVLFDLPTAIGEDGPGALPFFSGNQANAVGSVSIAVEEDQYTITLANNGVDYVTEPLAFNGNPLDLASVRFTVPGSPDTVASRGGLWLNDIDVRGIATAPAADAPVINFIVFDRASGEALINFQSQPGASYTIEESSDLATWNILDANFESEGTETEFIDSSIPPADLRRFYRLFENP